ncbi:hypothetical protein [Haloferula sargassicola]|uniref:hypothetical protein n=1 Tax=Haloferula sargassicola TaxID=490096 RepID=UPI003365633C
MKASIDDAGGRAFLVDLGEDLVNRHALNKVLAQQLANELKKHWKAKNATPNKLGGKRTNFWATAAGNTTIDEVTDEGATVKVGGDSGQNIRIHLFGGTIKPKVAKFLTIPLVAEAHGLAARSYERETGRKLFAVVRESGGFLFERNAKGADRSTLGDREARVKGRKNAIALKERTPLRPVYLLRKRATIDKDLDAIPKEADLAAALEKRANAWFSRQQRRKGGLA